MSGKMVYIATRGSALALAQANMVMARCEQLFPEVDFELKIIKTTGDKLQTLNLTNPDQTVTKGLFTKELEMALLNGEADFAVHSLKDLPTELPDGLHLAAVGEREDPRDVLIYREATEPQGEKRAFKPHTRIADLPSGATIATSSTRRQAQILALRPDLKTVPIRGNVGTRLQKLLDQPELDAIVLAMAGLKRLQISFDGEGRLIARGISGFLSLPISLEEMLPCVGQAALGIESRIDDQRVAQICAGLNHSETFRCVTAERAFLHGMGGGCLSPVAAYAQVSENKLRLRAVSFRNEKLERTEICGAPEDAVQIGQAAAAKLLG